MSLIGKEISDFTVQAFADGKFREVSKADVVGKWAVFFFYPADFTFVCPTELEDLANKYEEFKAAGCEIYSVAILYTRHGTMRLTQSKRLNIRCWQTRPDVLPETLR